MKNTLLLLLATQLASYGAISISGIGGSGFLAADVPVGALTVFILDDSSNGFLNNPLFAGTLTELSDPGLASANTSTDIGSRFGGDFIIGRASVTTAGQIPITLTGFDQTFASAPFTGAGAGRNFAILFFPTLTSASAGQITGGTTYGIIRGVDWTIPTSDGGYTASATAANYATPTVFARVVDTAGVITNATFGTATDAFQVVPEPTTALLSAVGALGLLRRRR